MNIFKVDLKRGLLNKSMLTAILMGILIIFLGVLMEPIKSAIQLYYSKATDLTEIGKMQLIGNSLNKTTLWNFGNYYYPLIMPLLCCIPYVTTYIKDKKSGFNKFQIIRTSYKKYIISKFITTFISGFLTIFFISFLSYFVMVAVNSGENYRSIFYANTFLSNLSNNNFDLFVFAYTLITSIMGGVYAIIGLSISLLSDNILVGLISPFAIYYLGTYLIASAGSFKFSPSVVNMFYNYPGTTLIDILIQLLNSFIIFSLIFFKRTYWSDIYE